MGEYALLEARVAKKTCNTAYGSPIETQVNTIRCRQVNATTIIPFPERFGLELAAHALPARSGHSDVPMMCWPRQVQLLSGVLLQTACVRNAGKCKQVYAGYWFQASRGFLWSSVQISSPSSLSDNTSLGGTVCFAMFVGCPG